MTQSKVREVLENYLVELGAHIPERHSVCNLCHCKWMIDEMNSWSEWREGKTFRWLGFIQGVFYCEGVYGIGEMKDHNRPDEDNNIN